jgi:protein-tyrosine-phosphatase
MKPGFVSVIGGTLLLIGAVTLAVKAQPIGNVRDRASVVFVCKNGVSMSVWSAAYFNRLASARGLRERANARAAIPSYTAVPLRMMFALAIDGFRLDGYRPEVVSREDVDDAELVVVIQSSDDTELPPDARADVREIELWQGFPPMREQYFPARAALRERIEALVERLASKARAIRSG